MRLFVTNVILSMVWAMLLGEINLDTIASGFAIAYAVLFVLFRRHDGANASYFYLAPRIIAFLFYYIFELIRSNLIVAWDIVTPTHHMRPGVVAIPLDAKSDVEITALANLITMTPGTLSLDISDDRKVLYVHAMYIDDVDKLRRETKESLERRVLNILR